MDDILARLKLNDARKPSNDVRSLDKLLHNLQDQSKVIKRQEDQIKSGADSNRNLPASMSVSGDSSSNSDAGVSTTIPFDNVSTGVPIAPRSTPTNVKTDNTEILRVKQELEAAKSVISRQEQELAETRTLKHTMDQAMGPPSEIGDFVPPNDLTENTIGHLQSAFNAAARPFTSRNDGWTAQDNLQVDPADLTGGNFGRSRGIWQNTTTPMADIQVTNPPGAGFSGVRDPRIPSQGYNQLYGAPAAGDSGFQTSNFAGNGAALGYDMRTHGDAMGFNPQQLNMRRNGAPLRINTTALDPLAPYQSYPPGATALTPPAVTSMGIPSQYYQQRGVAAPLSPTGTDFNASSGQAVVNPWPLSVRTMS